MRVTTAVVTLIVAAVLGCSGEASAPIGEDPAFAKGGKVTEPTATWHIPLNDEALALRSDGGHPVGEYSVYTNGVCGVTTKIFVDGSGDATILLDAARGKSCGRTITLVYPDGLSETLRTFANLRALHKTLSGIAENTTVKRTFAISPNAFANNPSRCGRLLFGVGGQGAGVGSDSVLVTRLGRRSWQIESQPEHDKALCEDEGATYSMPIRFVIVADSDLP